MAGQDMMLVGASVTFQSGLLAKIVGISDVGFDRASIENKHSDQADDNGGDNWAERLHSKLALLSSFQVRLVFDKNKDWKTAATAAEETVTITWAKVGAETSGGTVACLAAMTSFKITGELEGRVEATATLSPSGAPTLANSATA